MDIKRNFIANVCGILLVVASTGARADDIDIYFTNNSNNAEEPLVIFTLDWRPDLTSTVCNGSECNQLYLDGYLDKNPTTQTIVAFYLYRAVLKKVLEPLKGDKVGLMVNHDDGSKSCAGPQPRGKTSTNVGFVAFVLLSLQ
jgi:hypothetical protein